MGVSFQGEKANSSLSTLTFFLGQLQASCSFSMMEGLLSTATASLINCSTICRVTTAQLFFCMRFSFNFSFFLCFLDDLTSGDMQRGGGEGGWRIGLGGRVMEVGIGREFEVIGREVRLLKSWLGYLGLALTMITSTSSSQFSRLATSSLFGMQKMPCLTADTVSCFLLPAEARASPDSSRYTLSARFARSETVASLLTTVMNLRLRLVAMRKRSRLLGFFLSKCSSVYMMKKSQYYTGYIK